MPGAHQNRGWPSPALELVVAETTITQSEILLQTSGGPVLYAFRFTYNNGTAALATVVGQLRIDGAAIVGANSQVDAAAGTRIGVAVFGLVELAAGLHAVVVTATGAAAVGDVMVGGSGVLIAVELPLWRVEDTIE